MLTKVIRILDVNINMDKFYTSIFVYVLESSDKNESLYEDFNGIVRTTD